MKCKCGRPAHQYSASFVARWERISRWFPLYGLPVPRRCARCLAQSARELTAESVELSAYRGAIESSVLHTLAALEHKATRALYNRLPHWLARRWLAARLERRPTWDVLALMSKAHRKAWLRSADDVARLNAQDPEVREKLRKGAKVKKEYERLVEKQLRLKQRLRMRRMMRKVKRELKGRRRAIEAVMDQAMALASDGTGVGDGCEAD